MVCVLCSKQLPRQVMQLQCLHIVCSYHAESVCPRCTVSCKFYPVCQWRGRAEALATHLDDGTVPRVPSSVRSPRRELLIRSSLGEKCPGMVALKLKKEAEQYKERTEELSSSYGVPVEGKRKRVRPSARRPGRTDRKVRSCVSTRATAV